MIYKTSDGNYVISSRGVWLPGSYASEQAAKYAFRFSDRVIKDMQDIINECKSPEDRNITFEMLQAVRRKMK